MTPSIDIVAAAIAVLAVVIWLIRLEGRANAKADGNDFIAAKKDIESLQQKAREHGDLRDLVIEMKTEMREVREAIKDLVVGLRSLAPSRSSRSKSVGDR